MDHVIETTDGDRGLDQAHRDEWEQNGFTVIRGFADAATCQAQLDEAVRLSRAAAEAEDSADGVYVIAEGHPAAGASNPEDFVAKLFKLHRREPFVRFATDPELLALLATILGDDIDIFLSQFIFKAPEAYGQPWHQDSHYFAFSESHQVGAWLAVTRATLANGCLWVVPGTHREPIHEHVPDDRPNATRAYTKIVDHDTSPAVPMEMAPGDLLLFDSHLMHSSTDNETDEVRAAYVCHYSRAGVVDNTPEGITVFDWAPVLREGVPV
jgi:phytanoyl-CoA hydroxylase